MERCAPNELPFISDDDEAGWEICIAKSSREVPNTISTQADHRLHSLPVHREKGVGAQSRRGRGVSTYLSPAPDARRGAGRFLH